ncbi:hypothetical protein GKZ90_0004800 [Flavobacterium sp. MC2016-06]|jgi:hypothetical protein|uniref:hypothetical protein n=1 Tax=Flavobacterium sp. MC2016-06 TaxID=2676308 RepID=UPI0012BB13ED|nr:hypothetical protein [Flavobacterium sp. MC2016-06]MBU3858905.1 hypothetical protein [Flavobacterium sp. MC2016-06]
MKLLAESICNAIINAPLESIDLTEWLFTLKDFEYQNCSIDHLAAGNSLTKDGKRMSINVEQISGNLLIQHYVEDISLKDHCRVESISDSISAIGKTTLKIIWELKIKEHTSLSCELTNHVVVKATDEFLALLESLKITDLKSVSDNMLQNVINHNNQETPLFAKDIEAKALKGIWN